MIVCNKQYWKWSWYQSFHFTTLDSSSLFTYAPHLVPLILGIMKNVHYSMNLWWLYSFIKYSNHYHTRIKISWTKCRNYSTNVDTLYGLLGFPMMVMLGYHYINIIHNGTLHGVSWFPMMVMLGSNYHHTTFRARDLISFFL